MSAFLRFAGGAQRTGVFRLGGHNVFIRSIHLDPHPYTIGKDKQMFDKILIANRGEIACRVIQTARSLGIKTVAVYSEPDAQSKHVKLADEAVFIGPAASTESYLRLDKIIDAVKQTGAQAVHPGYGFLSENPNLPSALKEIGCAFIGPGPDAMVAMGDKIESKKIAQNAGVNTIPGFLGEVKDEAHVLEIANQIGYPIMVKASAGGGGKGMRIAWNDQEAIEGFHLSVEEAKSAFGDDRMLIEKFVDCPRHIEIQLVADRHGNAVYLPERECSIQRRNQKVIEEAPSTYVDPETRKAMGEQAVALAKAVGYESAGTVEMLIDSQKNFYFLEMNTRLQVEHPITEEITKVDLVEQMIRVAAGLPLSFKQDDVSIHGWATESRVYAENPYRNYLPSTGRLTKYIEPTGEGVRVDSGIREGSDISMYYDPMICKLVTHGETRDESLARMRDALDAYVIRGVSHNVPLLRSVIDEKVYLSGDITTAYLAETYPEGFEGPPLDEVTRGRVLACSAVMQAMREVRSHTISEQISEPAGITRDEEVEYTVVVEGKEETVRVNGDDGFFQVEIGDKIHQVDVAWQLDSELFEAHVDDEHVCLQVIQRKPLGFDLQVKGITHDVKVMTPRQAELYKFMPEPVKIDTTRVLISQMPGKVVSIDVHPGDKVEEGQQLCVMEAMKMQNAMHAERSGIIKAVHYNTGDSVPVDEIILEFE
eukprot:GFYU01005935.1.p1 GENE.GFYU01005935.1~~GFYU01005935.1.p1  ORF type:complete len:718 (+),score=223.45 GFYU01005935.1:33-2156(+)